MSNYQGFNSVELKRPQRSTFDLSHERRDSTRIGKLTPILIQETLPNDTFHISAETLIKFAPMIAPIFQRLTMYVHFFFIPWRVLWDEWETFITGGRLGAAVATPPIPPYFKVQDAQTFTENYLDKGSIADYFGIPPMPDAQVADFVDIRIAMGPFAAWYKVFTDYYMDRNFSAFEELELLPMSSGLQDLNADYNEMLVTRYRKWQPDYFTTALPWTQRGAEVLIPMEGAISAVRKVADGLPVPADKHLGILPGFAGELAYGDDFNPGSNTAAAEMVFENGEITINDLRRSNALQMWLERNALAGSRYNESILAHFGRRTSDGRLQRAEYLGGGKAVVKIGEVMTTAYSVDAEDAVVPPANPTGSAGAYGNSNRVTYNCEEHGFILGVLSVTPTTGYMQGMPRMFFQRQTLLDYPWPTFAHLGEQEVYKAELYWQGTAGTNNPAGAFNPSTWPVFGYQSRYADWKSKESSAHGDFRDTLRSWHLCRNFGASPTLNAAFTTYNDDNQDDIFNVTGVDTLWMYTYIDMKVKRSLPYYGTPRL